MIRYDTVPIHAQKTDEGFIRDKPVIGRTGVLVYRNADGSERREYRPPEEAFDKDSLASLKGKPITIGHQGMVTSQNAANIRPIGTVLSAGQADGDTITADVVLYSLPTSARELSCGYNLDLDETPAGEPYDAVQRHIRYNHVAGIIPAHAGLTGNYRNDTAESWDHPRACGAHPSSNRAKSPPTGSSPRMRGSQHGSCSRTRQNGIIPAHAGLTPQLSRLSHMARDHPRACGAH